MPEEIDTSFDVEEFERQTRAELEAKQGYKRSSMTPARELLEYFEGLMPKRIRESPKMQKWISILGETHPGETRKERSRRLAYERAGLYGL